MLSKTSLGIAAAGAGLIFLGYCIYFDKKRRNDPNYKTKIRERRKSSERGRSGIFSGTHFPDMNDTVAKQKFFFQEAQLGEEFLITGDVQSGIEHLSNAVIVCENPKMMLHSLQRNFPPQIFNLLLEALPAASQRLTSSAAYTETVAAPIPEETSSDVE